MDLDEYQKRAYDTAAYEGKGQLLGLTYATLGLASEAGEVAGKLKRIIRGDAPFNHDYEGMIQELGDVLWYVADVASELGVSLTSVAERNLTKLASRATRGVIKGAGDDR